MCPVCHGLRTGASSTNSALALKPYSERRVLPSTVVPIRPNIRAKSPSARGRLGDVRPGALLGGQPGDVAVVLDEAGQAGEEPSCGVRASATALANRSAARPPRRRRARWCARSPPPPPPAARPGRRGSPRPVRRRRGRPGRRHRRRGLECRRSSWRTTYPRRVRGWIRDSRQRMCHCLRSSTTVDGSAETGRNPD